MEATRTPVDRTEMLSLIREAPTGVTTAEVAAKTGLQPSTVRSHLDRLVDAGLLVKARANSGLPYRPAWRYRPAGSDPAPTIYRHVLAAVLRQLAATGDDTRPDAAHVGQRWGRLLAAAQPDGRSAKDAVLAVLDALGFTPRETTRAVAGPTVEVQLLTCPYMQLVGRHPDAMCGVHAGIVQGVLRHAGARNQEAVLEPFAAPGACAVRFSLSGGV